MEVANGFSEVNDPAEQERRFLAQMARGGEDVPKQLDVDYIRALCHGMPPTAGEGLGIHRLTMLLTDSPSIRDVILFRLLRPEGGGESSSERHGPLRIPPTSLRLELVVPHRHLRAPYR